jgi:phytoene dehydrogenase-like protein
VTIFAFIQKKKHCCSLHAGGDRKTLTTKHADLSKELEKLRAELAAYSEQDPVETEKKVAETQQYRLDTEKFTDQILVMEGWLKQNMGCDGDSFSQMLKMLYDDEFDEEEQALREL